jgi:L-malate glycosyltransferase
MTARPRRIVHLASGREWRGGQNQVLLLARALGEGHPGVEQVVVTGRGSLLAGRLRAAGVPVREAGWRIGLSPAALLGALAEIRRGPALLHAHDAHALTLAGVAARLTHTPFIATRRVDFHLRRRGFWARADRLIAISAAVRDILQSDGIAPGRITVVPSGIDLDAVRAVRPGLVRRELGLSATGPLAVAVGALVGHKDHATLVAAAAALRSRLPALHWAIAGAGPLRPALEARIASLELGDRVHLLGHVAEALRLVAAADVFVMSSEEEGLGTSVLDAMALGVPVAATRAGGIPEMLADGAGLLTPVHDGRALGESVARLLEDADLRAAVVRKASARVEQFSARAMAEGVLSVYRSVARDH